MVEVSKVEVQAVDGVRRRLEVEVPESEVVAATERSYRDLARHANVRGFRPGRVPRAVLERLFGERVRADVNEQLIRDSFLKVMEEEKIEPVGRPEITTKEPESGGPLRYSATVEVRPDFVADGYVGVEVERPLRLVSEADVDRALEDLRQSFAQLRPIEDRRDLRVGDVAAVDYEIRPAGAPVRRGENRFVEVGSGPEESLGGRLAGQAVGGTVDFEIEYPADHPDTQLAGRRAACHVVVRGLNERHVPQLDDEFAKDHGECDTLAELRSRVRQHLEEGAHREAEHGVRSAIAAELGRRHPIDVPAAMVGRRADAIVEDVLMSLGSRRPAASQEADFRARLRQDAEPRAREDVRVGLVLDAIARQEGLRIADDDLEGRIERIVTDAPAELSMRLQTLYGDPEMREELRGRMLRERALEWVRERAVVRDATQDSVVAEPGGTR